ncbi:MAG: hypothetical protein ACKOKE_00555 [Actinomycetota bacterium]
MRPGTRIAIVALVALLLGAAVAQFVIASQDRPAYPGPVPGTPLPVPSR